LDDDTDHDVAVLQAVYGPLGYQISRLPCGTLRAQRSDSKHVSDADSYAGLRKSIIERETSAGIHGHLGGSSGK
jgi:hypothetical protein